MKLLLNSLNDKYPSLYALKKGIHITYLAFMFNTFELLQALKSTSNGGPDTIKNRQAKRNQTSWLASRIK